MNFFFILAFISALATLGVLFSGVFLMGKNGQDGKKRSNKLMQYRVGLQVLTLAFLFLAVVGG